MTKSYLKFTVSTFLIITIRKYLKNLYLFWV